MKLTMKTMSLAICLALLLAMAACAVGEETIEGGQWRLRLGSSRYYVMITDDFYSDALTEDDIAEGQVGYYRSDLTTMDFDVYQIAKEGIPESLNRYVLDEAVSYDRTTEVNALDEINGIAVGWYRTVETYEDVDYDTITYVLEDDDSFIEIVFWMEDEEDERDALTVINSLDVIETMELQLGTSAYTLYAPDDFQQGSMTDEDVADDQVAYWYSEASLLDFDVYQFQRDEEDQTLADYVALEAEDYMGVNGLVTDGEINGIPAGWYRAVEEYEEGEYDTITYVLEDGEDFVEVVFWLDGPSAEEDALTIINTLSASGQMAEEPSGDEEPQEPEEEIEVPEEIVDEELPETEDETEAPEETVDEETQETEEADVDEELKEPVDESETTEASAEVEPEAQEDEAEPAA